MCVMAVDSSIRYQSASDAGQNHFLFAFSQAAFKQCLHSRRNLHPEWTFVISCQFLVHMIRPAPIFICPTSEFPICPSGSPTASTAGISFYERALCHQLIHNRSFGKSHTAFALTSYLLSPYPSRIINTVGFLLIPKSPLHLDCLIFNSTAYCTSFSTILQDGPPNKYT